MSRRKVRSGGGATNRSNDMSNEMPGRGVEVLEIPRSRSLGTRPIPEEEELARPKYTPDRKLGESFEESITHDSWRGFPRKSRTRGSTGRRSNPDAGINWRTEVRVGAKIDHKKRADLLAKSEKMAQRLREAFLEIDTSGDSRLDRQETLAMLQNSEAKLAQDEVAILQDFLWAGDVNDDGEISYKEFVDRFSEFIEQLRPGNVKEESHKAKVALAKSDLMGRLFKHRDEFLDHLSKAAGSNSMRMASAEEIRAALESMKKLKLTNDEIEWITLAANTHGRERFDPVQLIEAAAIKRGVELDLANRDFRRAVAMDVEETKLDEKTLEEFRKRAKDLQKKVGPMIDKLMEKIGAKTGDSLQRAFRALDVDKKGVLSPENLVDGFAQFGLRITDQQATDIVGACDINQDGHVAFPDFQQFFLESNPPYIDLDIVRQQKARPKGVPSQILQQWEVTRRGGAGQAMWFSQFHQGDWQGPFKGHAPMSACTLHDSDRWKKSFAPQHVDAAVLKTFCRNKAAEAGKGPQALTTTTNEGLVRGLSPEPVPQPSVDFERHKAKQSIQQARISRKQDNNHRIEEQIRDHEDRGMMRDQANVDKRSLLREDWMQRCYQTYMSIGNKYGKGYREPEVRHAFYAPTKLHFYPEGSINIFERGIATGARPQVGKH